MSWITNSKRAAAALLAFTAVSASAGTLVVRSNGPSAKSYPPGKALADHQKVVLKANDQLVILDGRGTRTLRGPGVFDPTSPAAATTDSRTTFAALVTQRTERRARIGAVRSVGGLSAPRNPNIWYVDIERSSTVCVADPTAVTLWRADMTAADTLKVTRISDGATAKVEWLKGASAQAWPSTLPISAGADYRLEWTAAKQPTTLRFAMLGPNPEGLEATAQTFIKNGCEAQLDLLIETVAIPGGSTPPAG